MLRKTGLTTVRKSMTWLSRERIRTRVSDPTLAHSNSLNRPVPISAEAAAVEEIPNYERFDETVQVWGQVVTFCVAYLPLLGCRTGAGHQ